MKRSSDKNTRTFLDTFYADGMGDSNTNVLFNTFLRSRNESLDGIDVDNLWFQQQLLLGFYALRQLGQDELSAEQKL